MRKCRVRVVNKLGCRRQMLETSGGRPRNHRRGEPDGMAQHCASSLNSDAQTWGQLSRLAHQSLKARAMHAAQPPRPAVAAAQLTTSTQTRVARRPAEAPLQLPTEAFARTGTQRSLCHASAFPGHCACSRCIWLSHETNSCAQQSTAKATWPATQIRLRSTKI